MGNLKLRRCATLENLKTDFKKIETVVSDDVKFLAEALLFLAERIDSVSIRKKRKPTTYQLKVGKYMKLGKPVKEAHRLAKEE